MRAVAYNERLDLVLRERSMPRLDPGWLRLRIAAVGICGSDLHMKRGQLGNVTGLQPGHEVAGWIDDVGDSQFQRGQLIALEPITCCGQCNQCTAGHYNRCPTGKLFGVTRAGGMADYLAVPNGRVFALPDHFSPSVAALAEPMAVAVRGAAMAPISSSTRVAILGAGTIGLLCIVAARARGAREIHITGRHPHQRALAQALGAIAHVSDVALREAVGEDAIDIVIETVGGEHEMLIEAVNLVARGGHVVVLGIFGGAPRVPGLAFVTKEATLIGANCYAISGGVSDFARGVELLVANAARVAPLVTHRFPLTEVERAFAAASDKSAGAIKVQVVP